MLPKAVSVNTTGLPIVNELVVVHSDEEGLKSIINDFDFSGLTVNLVENTGDTDLREEWTHVYLIGYCKCKILLLNKKIIGWLFTVNSKL